MTRRMGPFGGYAHRNPTMRDEIATLIRFVIPAKAGIQ